MFRPPAQERNLILQQRSRQQVIGYKPFSVEDNTLFPSFPLSFTTHRNTLATKQALCTEATSTQRHWRHVNTQGLAACPVVMAWEISLVCQKMYCGKAERNGSLRLILLSDKHFHCRSETHANLFPCPEALTASLLMRVKSRPLLSLSLHWKSPSRQSNFAIKAVLMAIASPASHGRDLLSLFKDTQAASVPPYSLIQTALHQQQRVQQNKAMHAGTKCWSTCDQKRCNFITAFASRECHPLWA